MLYPDCIDVNGPDECKEYKDKGLCEYVKTNCAKTCGFCGSGNVDQKERFFKLTSNFIIQVYLDLTI